MTPEFYRMAQQTIREHVLLTLPKHRVATSAHFENGRVTLYFDGVEMETMPQEIYFKFMEVES